jgi:hypothetical protein
MPFTEEQAPFFFGRDADREIITANLLAAPLTLLYGPSGVGKSSVLNAGVVHHLRRSGRDLQFTGGSSKFAIVSFRTWRDDPLAGLERTIEQETGTKGKGDTFADRLQSAAGAVERDILIILDQFEEYFMYHPGEDGDGTFAVEFPRAVNRRGLRASFLVSMREDSIAKLDFFKGRIPNLFDNYLRIDRLDRHQAREAIVRPIEQFNRLAGDKSGPYTVEPGLVDAVLDQVRAAPIAREDTGRARITDADLGIETPHLQLVLTRLWQEEVAAGSKVLRLQTLSRLGGASEIVKRHVESALDALTQSERDAAARIFQYLVTPAGTKIALGVDDLYPNAGMGADELRSLLVKLSSGESRILTPVAPAPDQPARERYQIFHDVLAGKVLDWRRRYVTAAEQRAAEAVAAEQRARAEKEARSAAKFFRLLIVVGALLLLVAGAATVAWQQTRVARAGRRDAEQSKLEAQQSQAEAELAKHNAEASRLDLLAANTRNGILEAEAQRLRLSAQEAEARFAGRVEQANKLRQQAAVVAESQATQQQTLSTITAAAQQERTAAEASVAQVAQIKNQISAQYGAKNETTAAAPTKSVPDVKETFGGDADRQALQAIVGQYKAAFEGLNIAALRAIWPTAPRTIESSFDQMQSYELEIRNCEYTFSGENRAAATCAIRQTAVTKRGGRQVSTNLNPKFAFTKAGGRWLIADAH